DAGLDERLATPTLGLVRLAAGSGDEGASLASIAAALPEGLDVVDREDGVLFAVPARRRDDSRFVVLAGHVDTVPLHGSAPGGREGDAIVGRRAAGMEGGAAGVA